MTRGRNVELVEVDVRGIFVIEVLQVRQVEIAGRRFRIGSAAVAVHERVQIRSVRQTDRVSDFMEGDPHPPAVVGVVIAHGDIVDDDG